MYINTAVMSHTHGLMYIFRLIMLILVTIFVISCLERQIFKTVIITIQLKCSP